VREEMLAPFHVIKKGKKVHWRFLVLVDKSYFSESQMPQNRGAVKNVGLVCKFLEIFSTY